MSPMTSVRIIASIIYTEWISRRRAGNIAQGGNGCHDKLVACVKPAYTAGVYISKNWNKEEIS